MHACAIWIGRLVGARSCSCRFRLMRGLALAARWRPSRLRHLASRLLVDAGALMLRLPPAYAHCWTLTPFFCPVTTSARRRARSNCRNDIKLLLHPQSPRATFAEEPPPRARRARRVRLWRCVWLVLVSVPWRPTFREADGWSFMGVAGARSFPCVARILQQAPAGSAVIVIGISSGLPLTAELQSQVASWDEAAPVKHSVEGHFTEFEVSATAQQLLAVGWPASPAASVLSAEPVSSAAGGASMATVTQGPAGSPASAAGLAVDGVSDACADGAAVRSGGSGAAPAHVAARWWCWWRWPWLWGASDRWGPPSCRSSCFGGAVLCTYFRFASS